jgi:glycosyltransferase involved in cell wall biosynthesis
VATLVMIPALNEAATITTVVKSARHHLDADVLVIDDGSSDDTADLARAAGAMVLSHPFNMGVGAAIRTAIRFAVREDYEVAIQLDADGQHPAEEALALLHGVDEGHDLVLGSRFADGYQVGRFRRLAMRGLAAVASRSTKSVITDATSGFRAFSRAALDVFAKSYPSAYLSDTVEALLIAGQAGLDVTEVPVSMLERQGGAPSAGPAKSLAYLLRLYLVIVVHPLRPRPK